MDRAIVQSSEHDDGYVTWFDYSKIVGRWSDIDVDNTGALGVGRGYAVIRTAGGAWVQQRWTLYGGETPICWYIDDDRARIWLLRNGHVVVAERYLGLEAEERGPGRPEIGPLTTLRLGEDLTGRIDDARAEGESRAAAIRRLLAVAFDLIQPAHPEEKETTMIDENGVPYLIGRILGIGYVTDVHGAETDLGRQVDKMFRRTWPINTTTIGDVRTAITRHPDVSEAAKAALDDIDARLAQAGWDGQALPVTAHTDWRIQLGYHHQCAALLSRSTPQEDTDTHD